MEYILPSSSVSKLAQYTVSQSMFTNNYWILLKGAPMMEGKMKVYSWNLNALIRKHLKYFMY